MIPDLSTSPAQAKGSLQKISVRKDPDGSGPDDLLFDLDIAHMLDPADAADVGRLDAVIPGAAALAASANNTQTRARLAHTVDRGERWVSVADSTGKTIVNARKSEVRSVTLRLAGPLVTMTVKHRVRGLDLADAARLMRSLDGEVDVEIVDAQQTLFGGAGSVVGRKSAIGRGWTGSGPSGVGLVVTATMVLPGGEHRAVVGIVHAVTTDPAGISGELLLVRDTATEDPAVYVSASDVSQTIAVCAMDGQTVEDVVNGYVKAAEAGNLPASWDRLIEACGSLYAEDGVGFGPNDEFLIDDRVVTRAIDLAQDAA